VAIHRGVVDLIVGVEPTALPALRLNDELINVDSAPTSGTVV
jgi:hypothetical protein